MEPEWFGAVSAAVAGAALPEAALTGAVSEAGQNFSFLALFQRADWVVKSVMLLLTGMSVWSWAIVADKQLLLSGLRSRAKAFEERFWSGRSLDDLEVAEGDRPREPMGKVFAAAMREFRESRKAPLRDGAALAALAARVDKVMNLVIARELSTAEKGLGVLATVASSSPFIGLFGTVWGIMNAFREIAAKQDTSLAVVAPGIAEALFATALGLLAAIPATIFYNKFATDVTRYGTALEGFADELSAILSRKAQERVG